MAMGGYIGLLGMQTLPLLCTSTFGEKKFFDAIPKYFGLVICSLPTTYKFL